MIKHYPFHELDFLTREQGIKYVLAYFNSPSEESLENIRINVKPFILPYFEDYFWIILKTIDFTRGNKYLWVSQILEGCFMLAMWDIKHYIYDEDGNSVLEYILRLMRASYSG